MDGEVACAKHAAAQGGVLSRSQALEFLSARQIQRRLARGLWERVFPSVYRLVSTARSWRQTALGAVLWAGRGCVLSHESAAVVHGLSRFRPGRLVLTVRDHHRAPGTVELHHSERLSFRDVTEVQGLPVTTVARTLLDLAVRIDGPTLRATVDEALRKKLVTLEVLEAFIERSHHLPGVIDLRAAVAETRGAGAPTESELERAVHELLRDAGFPIPQRQRPFSLGTKRCRLDFTFPAQRVVIEADGLDTHFNREAFEEDRRRDNHLTARGFKVLRWTWRALHERPWALLEELAALLHS